MAGGENVASGQRDRTTQRRDGDRRAADDLDALLVGQLSGNARRNADGSIGFAGAQRFAVTLPFGTASYRLDSLTLLAGTDGILVPAEVEVDFSRDENAPVRQLKIQVRQGIPAFTELRLAIRTDGRGLRPVDLEAIDLPTWLDEILAECTYRTDATGALISCAGERTGRRAVEAAQRSGRRKVSPQLLERVAALYRENVDAKPIEAISAALGVSYRTAARYVELCRSDEFGILPTTHRGKRKA